MAENVKTLRELEVKASEMLKTINDLIEVLCELRESSAAIDKIIIDELYPIPAETLAKQPRRIKKNKKKNEETLNEILESIPDGKGDSVCCCESTTLQEKDYEEIQ
jgi:hypothetical protein